MIPGNTLFILHLNRKGYMQWAEIIKSSLHESGIEP